MNLRAALQLGKPFRVTLPAADGTIDSADRAHLVFAYYVAPQEIGEARCGWVAGFEDMVWLRRWQGRVWFVGASDRVFTGRPCS